MKFISNKKSQTSIEFSTMLALVIILAIIFVGFYFPYTSFFGDSADKDNVILWTNQEVGLTKVEVSRTNTILYIVNNQREPIVINDLYLNDIKLNVTPNTGYSYVINSSKLGIFSSNYSKFKGELLVKINYTIGAKTLVFDGHNTTFKELQKI